MQYLKMYEKKIDLSNSTEINLKREDIYYSFANNKIQSCINHVANNKTQSCINICQSRYTFSNNVLAIGDCSRLPFCISLLNAYIPNLS